MQVRSFAKINWSLRVTGKRPDGFHDIETVFQSISLYDTLTFTLGKQLVLTCDDPSIPTDETNLVMRAARALGSPPVAIHIAKRIPAGGGLGGGSSNAASTLTALTTMVPELMAAMGRLPEIARTLGSDVPFFLVGGTAYATGRGEVLTPLDPVDPSIPLLLLIPEERVLTKEAYAGLTQFSKPRGIEQYRGMPYDSFVNDFEASVFKQLPRLKALKRRLLEAGARWAGMTGSGSTIVGAFPNAKSRDTALDTFKSVRAVACKTT
jgi:4-diphosphocytidyl-2-C-methyl-D-erythritol kinase